MDRGKRDYRAQQNAPQEPQQDFPPPRSPTVQHRRLRTRLLMWRQAGLHASRPLPRFDSHGLVLPHPGSGKGRKSRSPSKQSWRCFPLVDQARHPPWIRMHVGTWMWAEPTSWTTVSAVSDVTATWSSRFKRSRFGPVVEAAPSRPGCRAPSLVIAVGANAPWDGPAFTSSQKRISGRRRCGDRFAPESWSRWASIRKAIFGQNEHAL